MLEVWKESSERVVALCRDARGRCFVRKTHRGARAATRARREARALRFLAEIGIPAPRLLALDLGAVESSLDLELLEDHRPLEALLPELATERGAARAGLALLPAALALVRAARRAGLADPDLHAGNVLAGADAQLALIDLHRARLVPRSLARFGERRALRRFLRFFLPYATPARIAQTLRGAVSDPERLVSEAQHSRRSLLRGKDRRAEGGHRAFVREESEDGRWIAKLELDPALRARALRCAAGAEAPDELLKQRADARVFALDERWIAKHFLGAPRAARRRARAAWRASLAIAHSRVRACSAHGLWLGRESALLLLERGPSLDLGRWLHGVPPAVRAQLRVARELARAIAILHRDGLRPRDLRAENFLVDADLRTSLVDLDGIAARRRRAPALRRCARDIARLRASFPPEAPLAPAAIELFARTYAAERGLSPAHLRRWRSIAAARVEELWELWRRRGLRFDATGIHEQA